MQSQLLALFLLINTPLVLASPSFIDLPVERTGMHFSHSFDENNPRAYLYHSGFAAGGLCIGDVNGDQLPDLYFSDGAHNNALYLNRGQLRFEHSQQQAIAGEELWGTGASLIDIDADGDLDLFQVNYDAPIQFFRNDGKGIFTEEPGALGLAVTDASLGLSFADVDNDGDLDAYLFCNEYYQAGGRPKTPPFERRNGVLVVKQEFEKYFRLEKTKKGDWTMDNYGRANYLFLNKGSRSEPAFHDISEAAGIRQIGHSLSAIWWDYDSDGDLDLYLANDFIGADQLLRNDGLTDGIPRFTDVIDKTFPSISWSSMGSTMGDINNDGRPDLFSVEMSPTSHFKSKLNMGEMEGERLETLRTGWPRQAMRNHLFVHNGSPIFSETAWASGVASSDWSWSPKLADFDQDGLLDIFVANGITRNFTDSDQAVLIGDYDSARIGHTKWDLFKKLKPMREANRAFRNVDGRRFEKSAKAWGLDLTSLSYTAAWSDLDRDGDLDLVVSDLGKRSHIYENQLATGNSFIVELEGTSHNCMGLGAKVTLTDTAGVERTRWLQPALGFLSQNEAILHFGLGSEKATRIKVQWDEGMTAQEVAIENGIDHLSIKESPTKNRTRLLPQPWYRERAAESGIDFVHREKPFDDFARQPLLPGRLSQLGPGLAAGDVDGDGDQDLFIGGAAGQLPALLINEKGKFCRAEPNPFGNAQIHHEDLDALWFDADGDGDPDLYIVSGSVEHSPGDPALRDRLFINHSHGQTIDLRLERKALPKFTDSGSCVTAADYDGDGDLDLFVGTRSIIGKYPQSPASRLLRNESSKEKVRFVEAGEIDAPGLTNAGLVTAADWSDLDRDGDPDLILAVEWGPARLFINQEGKLNEQRSQSEITARSGWWSAVTAADIDGDGDEDILLGNVGINTKYGTPSATKPAILYYGDMDNSGIMRLVEAKNSENRLLPVRGKSCSSNAIPSLRKKFPTFRKFAMSDLLTVYSREALEGAEKFEANCLESGVLINETAQGGKLSFRWQPMPWNAQLSIINDIAIADFDGLPGVEILCAQNFYTREPETGLWRGNPGCLLRWKNDAFELIPHATSGLIFPNDTRGLAISDFNGDGNTDIAAAQNRQTLLLFIKQPD